MEAPGDCATADAREAIGPALLRLSTAIALAAMMLLRVVTSPESVNAVRDALVIAGIGGMTVTDVQGTSASQRQRVHYRGTDFDVSFVPRVELEIVLPDAQVADAINEILEVTRHDAGGEGRIFLLPVDRSFRIRTGEHELDSDDEVYWV
jgi:nitrogen regulatory protein P-II 2